MLVRHDIDVVVTRLTVGDEAVRAAAVLAASERRRAERFVQDRDRRRFIVRRARLRRLLAERLAVPAESLRFSRGRARQAKAVAAFRFRRPSVQSDSLRRSCGLCVLDLHGARRRC